MGGKTAALRTLGFLAACVSLGLPVPAARASIPLFDDVAWIGIGSGENG
jgi:dsDNA-specific endonuclease/ATPase MutS2